MQVQHSVATHPANIAKSTNATQHKLAAQTTDSTAKPTSTADKVSISPEALALVSADNAKS
ncbi:MAG: hypothetical protein P4L87_14070 [Formivibrio sp.]|nr:hypothetical protein [Formivibrio sp.]